MLDVESSDDINYTKLVSVAINVLSRTVSKDLTPLLRKDNPARNNLFSGLRAAARKFTGDCKVYVAFHGSVIVVYEADPVEYSVPTYIVEFFGGRAVKVLPV